MQEIENVVVLHEMIILLYLYKWLWDISSKIQSCSKIVQDIVTCNEMKSKLSYLFA